MSILDIGQFQRIQYSKMLSGETTTVVSDSELWTMIFQFISYFCAHKPNVNEESLIQSVKRKGSMYNRDKYLTTFFHNFLKIGLM